MLPELTEIPGGLVFRENLMWFPTGNVLSINQAATALRGVRFEKNVVAARALGGTEKGLSAPHYEYRANHAAGGEALRPVVVAGGAWHESPSALGILEVDAATGRIESQAGSPAARAGRP